MGLNLADIEQSLDYLLFVEHEEDMKGYTHLRPLLKEIAEKVVIRYVDQAVAEYQRDITTKIATHLRDEVEGIVFDERIETQKTVTIETTIDDVEGESDDIHAW
jgi:hypothetical protein